MARKKSVNAYEYVSCRASGHSWDQIPTVRKPEWGTLLTFRCIDCHMVREDVIDAYGNLSHRNYIRPEGYEWEGEVTRADWRQALVVKNGAMVKKGKRFVMELDDHG